MTKEIIETMEDRFNKIFPCIQSECDNYGNIPVMVMGMRQISETECEQTQEWEAEQCQYCFEKRFPLREFIKSELLSQQSTIRREVKGRRTERKGKPKDDYTKGFIDGEERTLSDILSLESLGGTLTK